MATRPSTDHVVCDATDGGAFRCLNCGDRYMPAFPQPLAIFCESAKGYALMHKHCQPRTEPSKQVELFDALARKEPESETAPLTTVAPKTCPSCDQPTLNLAEHRCLGISATTDEPDPETDPPEHDKPELKSVFMEMFPMASDVVELRRELKDVLDAAQFEKFLSFAIPHPGTTVFDEIAHWSRVNRAHSERQAAKQRGEPSIDGLYVPGIPPMPKVLRDALGNLAPKGKKGARPLSNPPKKRRSGSTQHTS